MKNKPCYLLIALLCLANNPFAQTQKIIVDKIVARIGDEIILKSDINENACLSTNTGLTPKCELLEYELLEKALAIQAAKDSLVSDDEVEIALNNRITGFISQYRSPAELEKVAGKSIYKIKEDIRQAVKQRELANEMRNKILRHITVTPAEVKAYFDKAPAFQIDESLEVSQLIVHPKPNKAVVEYITNQLLGWKHDVETGRQKFDNLAKLYSMDPGSRDDGGQYAANRSDHQWDPVWFGAICKLKDGQISPVIKSQYGYHIIQMVSRTGDDAIIRHILLIPQVTKSEISEAQAKLDSIRSLVVAGKISFKEAQSRYNDGNNINIIYGGQEGDINESAPVNLDMLDKNMLQAVKNLQQG